MFFNIFCPICGESNSNLWFKELRNTMHGTELLYKCGNCAYVNILDPILIDICVDKQIEYHVYGKENNKYYGYTLDGKKHEITSNYPLFGRDFHGIPPKEKEIYCPKCGKRMKMFKIRPFIRETIGKQYRCDISYTCGEHNIAFGVHITKKDYELLKNYIF